MYSLIEDKEGLRYYLDRFYHQLIYNDLLFATAFISLHFIVLSDSGITCSQDNYLDNRGFLLKLLLETYWIIIISLIGLCCFWRCFLANDMIDSNKVIVMPLKDENEQSVNFLLEGKDLEY